MNESSEVVDQIHKSKEYWNGFLDTLLQGISSKDWEKIILLFDDISEDEKIRRIEMYKKILVEPETIVQLERTRYIETKLYGKYWEEDD